MHGMTYLVHNYSTQSYNDRVSVEVYLSTNDIISEADTLLQRHSFTHSFSPKSRVRVHLDQPPPLPTLNKRTYYIGVRLKLTDAVSSNNYSSGQDAAAAHVNYKGSCPPFVPGPDACTSDYPCDEGQGDCDSDADCAPGLTCVQRAGAKYGWPGCVRTAERCG